MTFPRLMTAMITPYDENLKVNLTKAGELAEYLCNNGSEGIVVCGTTGESPVLSSDEKLELYSTVQKRVGDRAMVWAGTGSNNTDSTIKLSREAEKTGVKGIMLVVPYYNKPSQEGLYQHFKKIADSLSVPVMLYNIPGRTNCNMIPDTVARLAAVDNILALKESSGDMDQMSLLNNTLKGKITVYSGDDSLTLPMMALGAHGVVSIASHLAGKKIKAMIDAFTAGKIAEARELHSILFPIFKGLFITTNPVPLKAALNMLGMEVGGLRLPLCQANEKEMQFIRELLLKYDLLK
ncbi:MAG: 4-hydroxy-tetrahydrodipicolinate synthase [Syntrophomonadaceae bacterium]|nr:4-hydroxy-tetrahydrodipicolinate synthase [Syntrophomonadaceae bacterium]